MSNDDILSPSFVGDIGNFKGGMHESLFDVFCFSRGFHLAFPSLHFVGYDRLFSMDEGKTWKRVQVKSPRARKDNRSPIVRLEYDKRTFDYLFFVYKHPYLIPYEDLKVPSQLSITPKLDKYKA